MEKKTYKDLKDGDTVYMVENADVFEELTVKIREEYYPRMIDEEEKDELHYFLELFHQDGTEYKYHWIQLVEKFKDATSTHDYDCFEYLWGSVCFSTAKMPLNIIRKLLKSLLISSIRKSRKSRILRSRSANMLKY